jgi:hypothetical protein
MSEKVTDGLNGLHFRRRDAHSLADVMRRAATEPDLWGKLRLGIPPVHSMREHVAALTSHYNALLARPARQVEKTLTHA